MFKVISIVLFIAIIRATNGIGYEALVPNDLHKCCGNKLSPDKECSKVNAAAFFERKGVIFMTGKYVEARIKSNDYPEVLSEISIRKIIDWDWSGEEHDGWQGWLQQWFDEPGEEIQAAVNIDKFIWVRRGDNFYKFATVGGKAVQVVHDCRDVDPTFCDTNNERLVALASYRGRKNDLYVEAFHKQLNVSADDVNLGYRVTTTRNGQPWAGGRLSPDLEDVEAMVVYDQTMGIEENEKMMHRGDDDTDHLVNHGLYFNSEGFACPFKRSSADLEKAMPFRLIRRKNTVAPGLPMPGCYPTRTFIGCPQSWCYNSEVDDIIVTRTRESGNRFKEEIVVYRGHYFWKADADRKLPIIPKDTRHQDLLLRRGGNDVALAYIDAAESFTINGNHFIFYYVDDELYMYRGSTGDVEVHVKGTFNGGKKLRAGFDATIYDDSEVFNDLDNFLPGRECKTVDTMWYNQFETKLYFFCGMYFESFTVTYDKAQRVPVFSNHYKDLISNVWGNVLSDLDGTLTLGTDAYFLKGNLYWQLKPLKRGNRGQGAKLVVMSAFGALSYGPPQQDTNVPKSIGLFATKERCGYTDEKINQLRALARLPLDEGLAVAGEDEDASVALAGTSTTNNVIAVVFIALLAVLLVVAVGISYKRKQMHRQRVGE